MMWIHERKNWPRFSWDEKLLASQLADLRYRQGILLGRMSTLGFDFKREASLNILTSDILTSSAIEGEKLDHSEVRSSIARKLGLELAGLKASGPRVDGIVEMMLDATQNFSKPLSKKRLCSWHAALFPTGHSGMQRIRVADWRKKDSGPMQVLSGPIGREKIHFEAPQAQRLAKEMTSFMKWFDDDQAFDPILKAGIAHFWFVTLHPFEDGNGRIARAIGDMALARADGLADRYYSLSTQIEVERKNYYAILEKQQRSDLNITHWLSWFLECLGRAISSAEKIFSKTLFKAQLWNYIKEDPINERQKLIINRMLEDSFEGHMNTSKYAKLAKCSTDTALRDIQELKKRSIFIQNPGRGRSTSYRLTDQVRGS